MSEFILSVLNSFRISKAGEPLPRNELIVGRRNPEQPIIFKPGTYYYNPLYDGRYVFIYREDHKLLASGSLLPAAKTSLKYPLNRTWFEVIPQPLQSNMIPAAVRNMIAAIPKQAKPIAQSLLQHLGIRVPADFQPTDADSWYQWLDTVQLPLGPVFKDALIHGGVPLVGDETKVEFLTGTVLPASVEIQIRMFQISEVTKRVRQIRDTNYVSVRVPKEILEQGVEAVKAWIREHPEIAEKFSLEKDPISEHLLEDSVTRSSPVELIGWQLNNKGWIHLWGPKQDSPNDLIRQILEGPQI